jgi:hypothetical protein
MTRACEPEKIVFININGIFNENKNLNNNKIKENKKQHLIHRIFIKFETKILTQRNLTLIF